VNTVPRRQSDWDYGKLPRSKADTYRAGAVARQLVLDLSSFITD
jgi:hypothetical protein